MMKRLALLVLFLSLPSLSYAQATHVSTGGTLPASCRVGDLYYKTGTGSGLYNCSATNTWTVVAAGSVTATGTLTSGKFLIGNGTSDLTVGSLTASVVKSASGTLSAATSGSDYAPATSGSLPLFGNGSGGFTNGTVQGNTTKVTTYAGSGPATNDCAKFDANGNVTSAGASCGTSSGSVTNTGTLTSGKTIIGNGTSDVTVSSLTATVVKSASGTLSAASAGTDYVAPGGALGTPSSGTATNITGLPLAGLVAASDDQTVVSSGSAFVAKTLPSCTDTGGNHLNYDQSTNTFSCGTSGSGGGGGSGTVTHTGALTSGQLVKGNGTDDITVGNLSGDVTTSGSMATTIANSAVTLAKIANASANSKLLGSGASGSGSAYAELTLGTNLSMSGTTLNATGSGGASTTQGVYSSLPGTCTTGDLYFFTDAVYDQARCSATNTWSYFLYGKLATPPGPKSGWTGVNTGANWTEADASGAIDIQIARNASLNWRGLFKAQPSTPYTATFYFRSQAAVTNSETQGTYFYDGTKWMGIEFLSQATGTTLRVEKITSSTVDGSTASIIGWTSASPVGGVYARLANSGATLTFSWSLDGVTFYTLFSESVGTYITPTHYGFGGLNAGTAGDFVTISMQSVVVN